jgi:general secretion pathway protein G
MDRMVCWEGWTVFDEFSGRATFGAQSLDGARACGEERSIEMNETLDVQSLVMVTRKRRRLSRGVTLVEVLIVVAIMALIAGGAAILVFPSFKKAKIEAAKLGADTVRQMAQLYLNLDATDATCPTVKDLVTAKKLEASKTDDPWGVPYVIDCQEGGEIRVLSNGADRQPGTPDDVRDDFKPSDIKRVADL